MSEAKIGVNSNRLDRMREIKKLANEMFGDLTPAQHEEIFTMMEDKTIYNKVKQTIHFFDTEEAGKFKKVFEK